MHRSNPEQGVTTTGRAGATPPAGSAVEFVHVAKTFTQGQTTTDALKDINLTIHAGEILGIIGYSGAGKSTLVRMVNLLDSPTSGQVLIKGTDITTLPAKKLREVRRDIGMIFQGFNLFTSRTVAGNIAYPLELAGWPKEKRDARVAELLDFVGLSDKGSNYPEQLSGGQKQRVGIARALATNPSILLADEATSALDPTTTKDVLDLLRRVNAELGVTIIVITHEMSVVQYIADRIAVMENGEIVEFGDAFEIFSAPKTALAQRFVASALHNRPTSEQQEVLREQYPDATLVTVDIVEGFDLGALLADQARLGVNFDVVFGGITSIKKRSFGTLTLALRGEPEAVRTALATLAQRATVEEI